MGVSRALASEIRRIYLLHKHIHEFVAILLVPILKYEKTIFYDVPFYSSELQLTVAAKQSVIELATDCSKVVRRNYRVPVHQPLLLTAYL